MVIYNGLDGRKWGEREREVQTGLIDIFFKI